MANQYHLLRDVNPNADGWKLRVRVARLWYQHVYMNPSQRSSMDMVLMDEEGSRISASVRTSLVSRFEGILVEGGVYLLSSFVLNDNDLRVKLSRHPRRISFVRHTKVKPLNSGFPLARSLFAFVRFGSIVERRVAENQAVDVIGVLSGYTDLTETTSDGHPTKRVSFELQDHEQKRLRCTLWSEHAEHFAERALSFHGSGYVIIIIQLGKVRNWLGRPGVSNCYYGTRVIINGDHPEVGWFRERVAENPLIPVEPIKFLDIESLNIDYTLSDFAPGCERILLNDIREPREPKMCIVVGKVMRIQRDQLWYYVGCCKCYQAVEEDALDGQYTVENSNEWPCGKCRSTGFGFNYRYKIQFRVRDHSGYASLCLFDTHAARIIGKSAYELFKSLPADADEDLWPEEVNVLVGNIYVFMVNISRYNIDKKYHVDTVAKISDQSELLAHFPAELELLQEAVVNAPEAMPPPPVLPPLAVRGLGSVGASTSTANASAADGGNVAMPAPPNAPLPVVPDAAVIVDPPHAVNVCASDGGSGSAGADATADSTGAVAADSSEPSTSALSPGGKRRVAADVLVQEAGGSPVKKQLVGPKAETK